MNLSFIEKKHGWWVEEKATIPCKLPKDGALAVFNLTDCEEVLNGNYPKGDGVWYFNDTKDREIAELRGNEVFCNPQVLWRHFYNV